MGQHAEDLLDWEYRKFERPHIEFIDGPKVQPKPKWRTKDGRTMYVKDMTTDHIINSINQFAKQGKEPYWALQAELNKRNMQWKK